MNGTGKCKGCNKIIDRAVKNANKLANGVQTYYVNGRKDYVIENRNMTLGYVLTRDKDQQVSYIKNTQGKAYVENTMDSFASLTDGTTVFASKTSVNTTSNIFRYGYYYYEVRLEEQVFSDGIKIADEMPVSLELKGYNDITDVTLKDGKLSAVIESKADANIVFDIPDYSAEEFPYVRVVAKINGNSQACGCFHIAAGEMSGFSYLHNLNFNMIGDSEYHTYVVCLKEIGAYKDKVSGLRLDIYGLDIGQSFEISEVTLLNASPTGIPTLSTARIFHTYSDKLHHVLQVAATEDTKNVAAIGMRTAISADTVEKLTVKDKNGLHESLDEVDWASAEYAGFDIKDAGIFGYILPNDKTSGTMTITLEGDEYVIIQSRTPENNTVLAGEGWPRDAATHICSEANIDGKEGIKKVRTVAGNDNDFFMGQRIYTDESHDFTAFITEAEIERNPLTDKDITVDESKSDEGEFRGYNALRGSYEFHIKGSDFNKAFYKTPNEQPAVNMTIKGNKYDRNIYILAATEAGGLECSALLDEKQMLVPVPIEVAKNFCGDGEENIYMRLDTAYGEAIFPLTIDKDDEQELTVLHLYQNWGNFALKQLSSIQYHAPYYHLSTGVTETNCLVPWRHTKDARIQNVLPDHRPMSAPMWSSQPQHTSGGTHTFLHYRDEKGNVLRSEVVKQIIDAYGPTYTELDMKHISYDGKIKISYTHAETPQTDENRAYCVMSYEFLDDMDFRDFKNEWDFYNMGKNTHLGDYRQIGYLDLENRSRVVDAKNFKTPVFFTLGNKHPYFSFFNMTPESGDVFDYVNLAFLVRNAKFIIGGKKCDPNFAVRASGRRLYLTLDLDKVNFKRGDKIEINAIIMPWGSYKSVYNSSDFAPDQNVRDVRANSMLNPVKVDVIADCTVVDAPFMPKVRSTNGKSAEFTLSGGENNITVRAYGFNTLTLPTVSEKIDGKWVAYELSSKNNPDVAGISHSYDGYNVYYDKDGTYSYSFVVAMDNGKSRTFKLEV